MNSSVFFLKLTEKILMFLHKDYQKIRVRRYRKLGVKIGENCRIFSDLKFAEPYLVSIGNNVTIVNNVNIITHDNCIIKFINNATDLIGAVEIGDNCFIGANSIILPGVTLGSGVIVGAGSVVTKSCLVSDTIIAGNPARIISHISDVKDRMEFHSFDFNGLSVKERKRVIEHNKDKLIKKSNVI